jgi:hypothetical protein
MKGKRVVELRRLGKRIVFAVAAKRRLKLELAGAQSPGELVKEDANGSR